MVIQHNMLAMDGGRQLGITKKDKQRSMEKLSSGFRINRTSFNKEIYPLLGNKIVAKADSNKTITYDPADLIPGIESVMTGTVPASQLTAKDMGYIMLAVNY